MVGRAGDAHGERLTFDFGAEPVQIGFGRGGVLSVHFRPLDLADNGRYDLYAEVRLVSPPAELPEPDLVWQLGAGWVLLALVRHLRRRSEIFSNLSHFWAAAGRTARQYCAQLPFPGAPMPAELETLIRQLRKIVPPAPSSSPVRRLPDSGPMPSACRRARCRTARVSPRRRCR